MAYSDDVSFIIDGYNEDALYLNVKVTSEEFMEYFSFAGLSMNPDKSEVISFQSSRTRNKAFIL